ncbi:MAG: hypothetical protein HOH74_08885, partial [Gemmatimonadetes bacterium]|nr:hypothetical protein [Gemmatimonadota bacterium]
MLEKVQVEVREWSGRLRSLACLLGLFTVTFPEPTQGHNGAVALAVPVTGITVDGDLSDWPQDMVSYPIRETNFASQPHSDFRDLEASFRIGYSATEGALYIGVEVHDDSVIVTAPGGGPIDACTILLTSSHDLGTRPGSRAERLSHLNSIDLHGKSVSIEGSIPATAVRSATIGDAHEISYEVRIDLSWSAYTDLDAALSLGFDILLNDTDGDGTIQTVSWGPGRSKRPFVNRIGDVMLLPAGQAGIPLVGLATWANGSPISFASIQVQSTHSPRLWCTVATDTSGSFRVTLRPDEYRITLQDPAGSTTTVDMRLGQLSHTRVQAPLPTGVRQVAGPGTEHWQTFDVTDGVASNSVKVLEQGRDGILWLGTEAGLTRYDGRKFISYTRSDGLTQQWIHDLAEDQHGDLWIAAGNVGGWDLFLFDGTAFTSLRDSLGLTEMVGSLHSDRVGNMWIGTEGAGLSRWDGSRLETFTTAGGLSNNLVNDIWEDASGGIWIATISGVDYWNGQNLVHHRPDEIGSTRIVRQDQSGDMWYVGGRGLLRSRHGRLETVSLDEGPTPLVLSSLQEDRHGRMWVGTLSGIRRLDMDGTISTFTQGHGLAFDAVVDLLEDRDGHMWAATGWFGMGGGVTRFSGDRFVTFGVTDGLPTSNIGQTIQDTDGHVWMAASQSQHNIMSGLTRYDGSSFTSWNKAGGLRGERPKLLSVGSDIWVGTQRFDGVTFQYYEPSSGSSAWGLA